MFLLASKKLHVSLLTLLTVVSILWFAESTAKDVENQNEATLPYVSIKSVADLTQDAHEAKSKQIPILLFFSMEHCPYCIEVEEDYLKPLLRNSEYDGKIIIRKVRVDSTGSMSDFSGKQRDVDGFGSDYAVSMVPTVILVDSHGNKISPSIVGIKNSHYYSSELDDAINQSTLKIRSLAKR